MCYWNVYMVRHRPLPCYHDFRHSYILLIGMEYWRAVWILVIQMFLLQCMGYWYVTIISSIHLSIWFDVEYWRAVWILVIEMFIWLGMDIDMLPGYKTFWFDIMDYWHALGYLPSKCWSDWTCANVMMSGRCSLIYSFEQRLEIGHWLDMVYLPPQGEFRRPYFSWSPMSYKDFATC